MCDRNTRVSDRAYNEYVRRNRARNPFLKACSTPLHRRLQIVVMSLTVVPVRLVLIAATTTVAWFYACIITAGADAKSKKPFGCIRMTLNRGLRYLTRVVIFCMGVHWITVRGRRVHSRQAPILAVVPHSAWLDVVVFCVGSPTPCPISRFENSLVPVISTLGLAAQTLYIRRDDESSRKNAVQAIRDRVRRPGMWPQLIIFPEGTTTNRRQLARFKMGAFQPGAAVQPVHIEFLNSWDTFTWTSENCDDLPKLVWKTLCQFGTRVRVTFLPPYEPSAEERQDAVLYTNNFQRYMSDEIQLPVSMFTSEDSLLMMHARQFGLPPIAGALEFGQLRTECKVSFPEARTLLQEYAKRSIASKGMLTYEQFIVAFDLPHATITCGLYKLYDRDEKGFMNYRDFVIGRMTRFQWTRETLTELFKKLSADANLLSVDDLVRLKCPNAANLFHLMTTPPLTKVSRDDFVSKLKLLPEIASFLEMLVKK